MEGCSSLANLLSWLDSVTVSCVQTHTIAPKSDQKPRTSITIRIGSDRSERLRRKGPGPKNKRWNEVGVNLLQFPLEDEAALLNGEQLYYSWRNASQLLLVFQYLPKFSLIMASFMGSYMSNCTPCRGHP